MNSATPDLGVHMEELKQKKKELVRASKTARQKMRRASRQAEVAQLLEQGGASEVCPKLEQGISKVLLLLLELASFCRDIVVSFVLGQGRPERYRDHGLVLSDPDTRRHIAAGVDLLYLGVTESFVVGLLESGERDAHSLCMYVVEYHLFHWLVGQNCEKGVYPRAGQVFTKACSLVPAGAPHHVQQKMRAFFLACSRATRYWLVSFRQRWGVETGLPPAGEDLEPGQLECKAPWSNSRQCLRFIVFAVV